MNLADQHWMARALELARLGQGSVEPNPMVGCVIVRHGVSLGEGWHQRFGGSHAEVAALESAGPSAVGATMYVTLEPCCHQGKTPPCVDAVIDGRVGRVVIAMRDPFPQVSGGGVKRLREAGIDVQVGLLESAARRLNAPYLSRVERERPWIIAKWAMTLDGRIAARSGDSRWISNELSRAEVHRLRGRVDAIVVGRGTAAADDPLLTARPPGPRAALRVVLDSNASLAGDSQLCRTSGDAPVLVAVSDSASAAERRRVQDAGCEVLLCGGGDHAARFEHLLGELYRRGATNVLVEGGGVVLGSLFDQDRIDEAWVFIGPKLIGGGDAPGPLAGVGREWMADAMTFEHVEHRSFGDDVCIIARRGL